MMMKRSLEKIAGFRGGYRTTSRRWYKAQSMQGDADVDQKYMIT